MHLGATNLPSTASCFCTNNNVFMEIYRGTPDGTTWFKVRDFDPIRMNLSPVFEPFSINGQ